MTSALSHIRVLDMSRILAGPWAGQMFADLGAEVIKVERPGKGDDTRAWGPPWIANEAGEETTESAYYSCTNRGKKSIAVDITSEEGQTLIRELAVKSDILLENYKVDGLKQYGLDYESLKQFNPRLIYCSITGFGQTGPYRHRAGYDFMIQGMGGLMSVTGAPEGAPGAGPQKVGVALADVMTGLYASNACLAALAYRDQSGEGQYIDLALLDVQVATLANQAGNFLATGQAPKRLGNAHPNIVPYQAFAGSDGYFILAVGNDTQFVRLCELLGRSDWANEDAYATNARRVECRDELITQLEPLFLQQSADYWITEFEKLGVPCGPINEIDEVFSNEQVQARGMQITREHPVAGSLSMVNNPIRMSATPVTAGNAPPLLGEHTAEVLSGLLGLDAEQLSKLRESGAID